MKRPTTLSKLVTIGRARVPRFLLFGIAVLATTIVITPLLGSAAALANEAIQGIFQPFPDDTGFIQTAASDVKVTTVTGTVVPVPKNAPLDRRNKFFDVSLGATGQSCSSCHQPDQGFTIQVDDIQRRFVASGGTDPLFHFRNTANNPAKGAPKAANYSVVLLLGATRIAKRYAPESNFTIAAADQRTINKFGVFPLTNDPEMELFPGGSAGNPTISAFRRPIVPTNLHQESAVLFDGAADIANILGQVTGGTMLLGGRVPTEDEAKEVGAFEFGVYTDQVFDQAAALPGGAGRLSAAGAEGGVKELREFALGPNVPCNVPEAANLVQTSTLSGAGTCVPNVPGFDIFDAWASLPNVGRNAARLSVARGQEIFNNKTLHVPADLQAQLGSTTANCISCHSKRNVGNNVDRDFFVRLGTDSVAVVTDLFTGGGFCATDSSPHRELQSMLNRVLLLPQYRVRANAGPLAAGCGVNAKGEIITADPGRAMVSTDVADTGKFRPVILRGLAARSPYFHAGAAKDIKTLVNFYNARFSIGFTEQEKRDLIAFLESL
jgi:cytochrome c peroxidase